MYLDPRKPCNLILGDQTLLYEPFYVGKGSGNRDTDHLNSRGSKNSIFRAKIEKIKYLGLTPIVVRVEYFNDEDLAYQKEEYYIEKIGSNYISHIKDGPLTNFCLKAQPPSHLGKTYYDIYGEKAEEQIEKRRKRQLSVGGYFGGRKHSLESREKIRQKTIKRWESESGPMLGKHHSCETKKKMSETAKRSIKKRSISVLVDPSGISYIVLHYGKFCEDFNLSRSTLNKAKAEGWKNIASGKTKGWKKIKSIPTPPELFEPLQEKLNEKPYMTLDELNRSNEVWVDTLKRFLSL